MHVYAQIYIHILTFRITDGLVRRGRKEFGSKKTGAASVKPRAHLPIFGDYFPGTEATWS
jgi:hypothetical protein